MSRSIYSLHLSTQLPVFKQQQTQRQRSAQVADHISKGPPDIAPGDLIFPFQGVGEPEKLPIGNNAVKHRRPPPPAQAGLDQTLFVLRAQRLFRELEPSV